MKIYLGTDHAGFELKEKIKVWLAEWGYTYQDMGALKFDPDDDYPVYISAAARKVAEDPIDARGIVLGGSGQGEAMVANRFPGVRAAVYYGDGKAADIPKLSREHNDANVLSLGARFLSDDDAKAAIQLWLVTPFSDEERHKRRIQMIEELDIPTS